MKYEKLKKARIAAGIDQADMGKKLGMQASGYQQKESGKRKFTVPEAVIIIRTLNRAFEDIFLE
jgi:Predicted transcriptional regulators